LQVKSHNKKITDLPDDLVKISCKYLSAADMVNVCIAIPSWEWILFQQEPYSYTSKWKWIDRRICTTLHSGFPTPSTADISKAVEQHFNQLQFDLQFPLIRAPKGAYEGVACLLFLSILAKRSNIFYPAHPLDMDCYGSLNIVNSTDPTSIYVQPLDYRPPISVYKPSKASANFRLDINELEGSLKSRKEQFAAFDCILYVLELSEFTRHGSNIVIELQAILRTLSSNHTFAIIIMDDVKKKEESGLNLFMDYAVKLGFADDSPLITAPMNWRIWHIKDYDDYIINHKDLFEWICQDVIWRRMQEWAI
ncbi:hypothetical protein TSMEX_009290, partial [Taenia solium]